MKKLLAALLVAPLLLAGAASAKIRGGVDVTISGATPTYAVHLSKAPKANDAYTLWAARVCDEQAEYLPVTWGDNNDPTDGTSGPFSTAGSNCTAYVWQFPDPTTPVSNTLTENECLDIGFNEDGTPIIDCSGV